MNELTPEQERLIRLGLASEAKAQAHVVHGTIQRFVPALGSKALTPINFHEMIGKLIEELIELDNLIAKSANGAIESHNDLQDGAAAASARTTDRD